MLCGTMIEATCFAATTMSSIKRSCMALPLSGPAGGPAPGRSQHFPGATVEE